MIARAVLDFSSIWSLFLALGYMLNVLCQMDFRLSIGRRLLGRTPQSLYGGPIQAHASLTETANLFINNTLLRYFGTTPLSWKAARRSVLLSFAFMAIVTLVMTIQRPNAFMEIVGPIMGDSVGWFVVSLFFLALLDWASYLQTYYFMQLASRGSMGRIVFFAYADVVLSINIFLLIFPLFMISVVLGNVSSPFDLSARHFVDIAPTPAPRSPAGSDDRSVAASLLETSREATSQFRRVFLGPSRLHDEISAGLGAAGWLTIEPGRLTTDRLIGTADLGVNDVTTLDWTIRYHGLDPKDVEGFVRDRYAAALSGDPRVPADPTEAAGKGGFEHSYRVTPAFPWAQARSFLYLLYGASFRISQELQAEIPEIFLSAPQKVYPLKGLPDGWLDILPASVAFSPAATNGAGSLFVVMCDDRSQVADTLPTINQCTKSVVIEADLGRFRAIARDRFRLLNVTVGVFFLGSFACTVVFYASLFLFLAAFYVLRLLMALSPTRLLRLLDVQAVHENSVWIVVAVAGLPFSILAAVNG